MRAQVQTGVSRLDDFIAELAVNAQEGSHTQALAGLKNLEAEVRALSNDTRGHLGTSRGRSRAVTRPAFPSRLYCIKKR